MQFTTVLILASVVVGQAVACEKKYVCESLGQGHNSCHWECVDKRSTDATLEARGNGCPKGYDRDCVNQNECVCWPGVVKRNTPVAEVFSKEKRGCHRECEDYGRGHVSCWWDCDKTKRSEVLQEKGCHRVCETFGNGHNWCYWDCDKAKTKRAVLPEPAQTDDRPGCHRVCESLGQGHNWCYWDCDKKAKREALPEPEQTEDRLGCQKVCESFGNGHNWCYWDCGKKAKRDATPAELEAAETRAGCHKECDYYGNGHTSCWTVCDKKRDLKVIDKRPETAGVPHCIPPYRPDCEWNPKTHRNECFCAPAFKAKRAEIEGLPHCSPPFHPDCEWNPVTHNDDCFCAPMRKEKRNMKGRCPAGKVWKCHVQPGNLAWCKCE